MVEEHTTQSHDPIESTAAPQQVAAPKPAGSSNGGFVWGTGRRKSAVARVRMKPGSGKFMVNGRDFKAYFCVAKDRDAVLKPLEATEATKRVDIYVNVTGGGTTGQAGAIALGVARALKESNADFESVLRDGRFLTRDSRKVERKKYGQSGARRRFQFSKR